MQRWLRHLINAFAPQPECPVCGQAMLPVPPQTAAFDRLGQGPTVHCDNRTCVFHLRPFRVTGSGLELLRLSPLHPGVPD